jgi:hypothetical protein
MTYQELPLFRATDPETSRQVSPIRVGSHRALLLEQYATATLGLTDEEAGMRAALAGHEIRGYWKRCSDLRTMGLIQDLGIRRAAYKWLSGHCVRYHTGRTRHGKGLGMTDTQFIYSFIMGWVSCWLWLKMMANRP